MHAVATDAVVYPEPDPAPAPEPAPSEEAETAEDLDEIADDPAIPDLEPDPTDPALPDPDLPTDYDIDTENLRDLDDDRYSDSGAEQSERPAGPAPSANPQWGTGNGNGSGSNRPSTTNLDPLTIADPLHVPARGALAIVPDHRDLARLDAALTEIAGPGHHVVLSEELGPAKRYQNWLAVLRGDVKMVIGTRSAMFAPVADLGFVAVWDDGDDLHAEPRAPYPHVREVLLLRAHATGAAALVGGYTCTAEGAQLVESRWAYPLTAFRSTVRAKSPLIRTSGEELEKERDPAAAAARLPNLAWRTARAALNDGPVLIQVPRGGYAPSLACIRCRKHARCNHCHGPLELSSGHAMASCLWCGRPAGGWRCDGDPSTTAPAAATASACSPSASSAPPRNSAAPSPTRRSSPRRRTPSCPACPTSRRSSSRLPAPNPWPTEATRPPSSSTAGPCWPAETCAPARKPCAAGSTPPRWCVPGTEGGKVVDHGRAGPGPGPGPRALGPGLARPPRTHRPRRAALPAAGPRRGAHRHPRRGRRGAEPAPAAGDGRSPRAGRRRRPQVRRPRGSQRPDARPGKNTDRLGRGERPEKPRPAAEDLPRQQLHRALVRVPRRLGGDLSAAVREAQGVRSARKAEDWVRVRIDPVRIG